MEVKKFYNTSRYFHPDTCHDPIDIEFRQFIEYVIIKAKETGVNPLHVVFKKTHAGDYIGYEHELYYNSELIGTIHAAVVDPKKNKIKLALVM